jgi:hypothetical protein
MPEVPSAEELSALPAAVLAERLVEAYRLIGDPTAQVEQLSGQVGRLSARVVNWSAGLAIGNYLDRPRVKSAGRMTSSGDRS